jgi:hypothetical protein
MTNAANEPMPGAVPAAARRWGFGPSSRTYSKAEVFMGGGALIVVLSDLAFALFGSYFYSSVVWTAAAFVVFAAFFSTRFPAAVAPHRMWLMLAATVVGALSAVRDMANSLMLLATNTAPLDVSYLLGMIGMSVGVVLMIIGASRIWRGEAS